MASTNKTTHYNLSQYVGSDKPTYLVDYNTDMSNIDTGIYNAKSEADNNASKIGTLTNLETTTKTDLVSAINELKGKTDEIGTLSNLTTEANTNLVSAINEVDSHTDTIIQNIGTMVNLETTNKSSLVGAINEVKEDTNKIGQLSNLDTTIKTDLVSAINEVNGKEDLYSTTEVKTNKVWLDGKPIYRKAFTNTTGTINDAKAIASVSDLDSLINLHGAIVLTNIILPISNALGAGSTAKTYSLFVQGSNVECIVTDSGYTNKTVYGYIEYTKTTD